MSSKGNDVLQDYEEMVKNPENHSLFDLVNLLQRVKKETEKLTDEEREQRATMAKKADGTTYCFLEKNLMRRMRLENAEKKLEQMIAEGKMEENEAKGTTDLSKYKYVIYARKSTVDEGKQVNSIGDQIRICEDYANKLGLNVTEIIEEK